jgi:hypothetical protein
MRSLDWVKGMLGDMEDMEERQNLENGEWEEDWDGS